MSFTDDRFPGLSIPHPNVMQEVRGNIFYGERVSIGPWARFVIPENSSLRLGSDVYLGYHVEIGPSHGGIVIGDRATIQDRCVLLGDVEIGRYCVFSLNIYISSGRHYYKETPHLLIRDQDKMVLR